MQQQSDQGRYSRRKLLYMRLSNVFSVENFSVSVEIFPPKTDVGEQALRRHLKQLVKYDPAFISCTISKVLSGSSLGSHAAELSSTIPYLRVINYNFGLATIRLLGLSFGTSG